MPIFLLGEEPVFPPVELADKEGVLAVGGDLSLERLINAYKNGIFPWFSENEPILWWSPDPRPVIFPERIHISRSMRRILNSNQFSLSFDKNFEEVVEFCRQPRKKQKGTWISDDMVSAYSRLHQAGYAHSLEVWQKDKLAGGLYGISLGRAFFAESMFYKISNASKFALIRLAQKLTTIGFFLIDCQVSSQHLESLGAQELSRNEFIALLKKCLSFRTIRGVWNFLDDI